MTSDDPTDPAWRVALGSKLFSSRTLSSDGRTSCSTCHDPTHAFGDGRTLAIGTHGREGTRNTPSLLTVRRAPVFSWDGRRDTLEGQITDALLNPNELGLTDSAGITRALPLGVSERQAVAALAAFVRSIPPSLCPLDRFLSGDQTALGGASRRGLELFRGRAGCAACHTLADPGANLTDFEFHPVDLEDPEAQKHLVDLTESLESLPLSDRLKRIPLDRHVASLGRFVVTLDPRDIGSFRTPSLRHVAETAPYFHDGRAQTLEEAVDREIYYRSKNRPLVLNPAERADLVAFLRSLSPSEVL